MKVQTTRFGELEVASEEIIQFVQPMPGIDSRQFVLLEAQGAFRWMQSLTDPHLTFVTINPFEFRPDYAFDLSDSEVKALGVEKPEDLLILSLVVVPEEPAKMTANLQAPVVIHKPSNRALQVILIDEKYHTRHLILQEMGRKAQAG